MTPTQRSLALLRKAGYDAAVVEKWNPHAKIRQDLFGVFDIVAISPVGILAVQTTTGDNLAARFGKVTASAAAKRWIQAGGIIAVHGWRKVGAKGKRKLWECRIVPVEATDFEAPDVLS